MEITNHPITIDEMLDYCRSIEYKTYSKKIKQDTISYPNVICSFDIETTSIYKEGDDGKYVPVAGTMYVWQFGVFGKVCIGRTWGEFKDFLSELKEIFNVSKSNRLVIWVHNLGFEFSFLSHILSWDYSNIFGKSKRNPINALTEDGFEFRCSFALTNCSLEHIGTHLLSDHDIQKLDGNLYDYKKYRGCTTELTEFEKMYCIHDCLVVNCYICEVMKYEKTNLAHMRMTSTGAIRLYLRRMCLYNKYKGSDYKKFISEFKLDELEYEFLKTAFYGAITHGNLYNINKVHMNVDSLDLTSSYPAVLCSEEFPMEKLGWSDRDFTEKEILGLKDEHLFAVFAVRFKNIRATVMSDNIISESSGLVKKNVRSNNGRVMSASEFTTIICNIDFMNYKRFYEWDDVEIYNVLLYSTRYLPKQFIYSVLRLYADKTQLKGVENEEGQYNRKKSLLNAVFGDCVQDPNFKEVTFDESGWNENKGNVVSNLEKYNNSNKRYNHYSWGVACTAFARYNLCTVIKGIDDNCKELNRSSDYIYSDTDCTKLTNYEDHKNIFDKYNLEITEKIDKCLEYRFINKEMARPKDINGVVHQLGMWELETKSKVVDGVEVSGKYLRFKTLGAKRYMYEQINTKTMKPEVTITVAGINKENGSKYMNKFKDPFEEFQFGLVIPSEYSGRIIAYHTDEKTSGSFTDYTGKTCYFEEESNICLVPSDYKLAPFESFENLMTMVNDSITVC